MAAQRKRACTSSSQASAKKVKHQVGVSTFEKWQREFEREYQRYAKDEANRSLVATLHCEVCRRFKDRIQGTNHRTSNVLDHAKSEQHVGASMARLQEEHAKAQDMPTSSYACTNRTLASGAGRP